MTLTTTPSCTLPHPCQWPKEEPVAKMSAIPRAAIAVIHRGVCDSTSTPCAADRVWIGFFLPVCQSEIVLVDARVLSHKPCVHQRKRDILLPRVSACHKVLFVNLAAHIQRAFHGHDGAHGLPV